MHPSTGHNNIVTECIVWTIWYIVCSDREYIYICIHTYIYIFTLHIHTLAWICVHVCNLGYFNIPYSRY
jgi:hypothetical protein